MDVGFSSLGTFSALFARRVGVAPTLYRRRVRTLVQVPEQLPHVLAPGCLSLMAEAFMGLGATPSPPGPPATAIFEKPPGAGSARLHRR
jgi:hypothetical protein